MKLLNPANAFEEGANLWFVPDLQVSSWTREIDWYLGFQIFKASLYHTRPIPEPLTRILNDHDLRSTFTPSSQQSVLALAVADRLPTDNVILISSDDGKDWLNRCAKVWQKAQKTSARLFLPAFLAPHEVETFWKEADNISLVLNK